MLPAPFLHGGQSVNSQPREVASVCAKRPREAVYSLGWVLARCGLASRGHVYSAGLCGWPALGRAAEGSGDGDGLALAVLSPASACGFHITEARVDLRPGLPGPRVPPQGSHSPSPPEAQPVTKGPCGQGTPWPRCTTEGLRALCPGPSHAVTQLCHTRAMPRPDAAGSGPQLGVIMSLSPGHLPTHSRRLSPSTGRLQPARTKALGF